MDKYKSFDDLKQHEKRGVDYNIHIRRGRSGISIMAPHGGGIEPGTLDVADAIAGVEHTFYGFEGTKPRGNSDLHIRSDRFDEPEGIRIAEESDFVLSIHGCNHAEKVIFVGGRDREFRSIFLCLMTQAGFAVDDHPTTGLRGIKAANLCNRGKTGQGGQIELSRGMRERMFENLPRRPIGRKSATYYRFVETVREIIHRYMAAVNEAPPEP